MARIIILDTSFLLELFEVPFDSQANMSQKAKNLLAQAITEGYDIFVPLPVVYELANHIVDVKNALARTILAERLQLTIESSWREQIPFTIVPCEESESIVGEIINLPNICAKYRESLDQGLSLADCTTVDLAERLKNRYRERKKPWKAHIWTSHAMLKAMEPDSHHGSLI